MPITYEDLKRCATLAREADRLREQIIRLQAKAERTSACAESMGGRGGAVVDPVGAAVANLTELHEKWMRAIKEFSEPVSKVDEATMIYEKEGKKVVMTLSDFEIGGISE